MCTIKAMKIAVEITKPTKAGGSNHLLIFHGFCYES